VVISGRGIRGLAGRWRILYSWPVIAFLRFAGLINAGVWLGGAVFFTIAAAPAFFSDEMLGLIGRPHAGAAAQIVLERYFRVQYWCGAIALAHLGGEWLYAGRNPPRLALSLVLAVFGAGLVGGLWLQPKLKALHLTIYGVRSTPADAEAARASFRVWHGVSQGANLLVIAGLVGYVWRLANPDDPTRFRSMNKFRG
jgi:hypothetical protein